MPKMNDIYSPTDYLVLGTRLNTRVPEVDQNRQRAEVEEILRRLRNQPGVILADEVGMGKTFVALAIAYSVAIKSKRGPVILMVPPNLIDKWEQDLKTFCELYLDNPHTMQKNGTQSREKKGLKVLRYGIAHHSVEFMKLLDDPLRGHCHLIFLAYGAMGRSQTDKWVRLAFIAEALRRHGRGRAQQLIQVKRQIHRFIAELLGAKGEEQANKQGKELWQKLLKIDPKEWKNLYNMDVRDQRRHLMDDPVPEAVTRILPKIDLTPLAEALKQMPIRARGGNARTSERLTIIRTALRQVEEDLWKKTLAKTSWRSPLLVMDEAHHLKNPSTSLARQLQSLESENDLRTGDGAMAHAFDRMLFLTATPFQLGHHELVRVLTRFGDVRWDAKELGSPEGFKQQLSDLDKHLNESQRTAITLQRTWSRLQPDECGSDVETWWKQLLQSSSESLTCRQRAVVDAFKAARSSCDIAQKALRPWILRHNKGAHWNGTEIPRRNRVVGAAVAGHDDMGGQPIPPKQLLPFFLAARSAVSSGQDLLGEALCSSYEAFRYTRQNRNSCKDEQAEVADKMLNLTQAAWYLGEFDRALEHCSGLNHPKIDTTVRKVVDLWEEGEKVLVFAFYRHTCRALRIHISDEIERRNLKIAQRQLRSAGHKSSVGEVKRIIKKIQKNFFDDGDSPGRRAVDSALAEILQAHVQSLDKCQMLEAQREELIDVMRRFLRVSTTLIRCFPFVERDSLKPAEAVEKTLNQTDASDVSWHDKFDEFIDFLTERCSHEERKLYLDVASEIRTGGIRVEDDEDVDPLAHTGRVTLANVQVATGKTRTKTRAKLMRAFNMPFFPDILVCSEVMGEGVDLQRFCRYVIHHDLDWNPSNIEQRTGRIDRLGCKAEGRHPIFVYLPYLAGTADERQYRVMSDREQWFRVVMGENEVAKLITPDTCTAIPLPESISTSLSFKLALPYAITAGYKINESKEEG